MRTTVTLLASVAAFLASLHHSAVASSREIVQPPSNPCAHGREGQTQRLRDNAQGYASDEDSVSVETRAELGLVWWPLDSVQLTEDPTVCAHVDSLITVWQSGPDAQSKNATRFLGWPGITLARVNPHKYMALPPFRDELGARWYFVVDSVSGGVRFFRGFDQ